MHFPMSQQFACLTIIFILFCYQFIRISHDSDPENVLRLLKENWRLELPKLLISVTGGAKSFTLHPKLKNVLRQGLLKVTLGPAGR